MVSTDTTVEPTGNSRYPRCDDGGGVVREVMVIQVEVGDIVEMV